MINQVYLKGLFDYCPSSGRLLYKAASRGIKKGDPFGTQKGDGYIRGFIRDKGYYAHRMVYLFHKGILPEVIDHIDRSKDNNKIENLREASISLNARNSASRGRSTSGTKGVTFETSRSKWKAIGILHGENNFLGRFDSKELAIAARVVWEGEVNYNEE